MVFFFLSLKQHVSNLTNDEWKDPKPIMLSGGAERAKCTLGYDFSEEKYITAASSIGGVLRDGAMAIGS